MKHLVWLLLLAFGTMLAQVPPVELPVARPVVCRCCAHPGACGMPACAPAPLSAQPVFDLTEPVRTVRMAAQAAAPGATSGRFYARFLPRAPLARALPGAFLLAPPASVSLFRAHCSLLI